jgi:predicted RNase H-like HicB family nuclease
MLRRAEGVFALASTREQVEARMAEALAAHIALLRERGDLPPEPHTDAGRLAA